MFFGGLFGWVWDPIRLYRGGHDAGSKASSSYLSQPILPLANVAVGLTLTGQ